MSSVMTPLNTLLLVFIDLIFHINGQWDVITSDQHLPRPDCVAAVGYWDSKIYILGGVDNPYQFTEYDIATDTYVDKGPDILPYPSSGHSQHYTQINDVIYWITWNTVYSYSITTDTYSEVFVSPTGGGYACLASYQDLILVIGGFAGGPIRNVQVFNTATGVLTAGPSLIDGLRDLTCAVDPIRGVVYAGSGMANDARGWLPLIEKLVIGDDIFSASWEYNAESLSYGTWGVRAAYVAASDSVYFVSGGGSTAISRLDCATGQVTKEADLNYECPNTMLIYAENKLYAFGGYNPLDTVQIVTNPDVLQAPVTDKPTTTEAEETTEVVEIETTADEDDEGKVKEDEGEAGDDYDDDDGGDAQSMETAVNPSESIMSIPLLIVGAMSVTFIMLICAVVYCWFRYKRVINENEDMIAGIGEEDVEEKTEYEGEGDTTTDNVVYNPKVNAPRFRLPPIVKQPAVSKGFVAEDVDKEEAEAAEQDDTDEEDESLWEKQEQPDNGNSACVIDMGVESPGKGPMPLIQPLPAAPQVEEVVSADEEGDEEYEYYYEYEDEERVAAGSTGGGEAVTTGGAVGKVDLGDFRAWNAVQVLNWMLSVEDGVFCVYEMMLTKEIFRRQVKGKDLEGLELSDMEELGIGSDAHRKLLMKSIVQLVAK